MNVGKIIWQVNEFCRRRTSPKITSLYFFNQTPAHHRDAHLSIRPGDILLETQATALHVTNLRNLQTRSFHIFIILYIRYVSLWQPRHRNLLENLYLPLIRTHMLQWSHNRTLWKDNLCVRASERATVWFPTNQYLESALKLTNQIAPASSIYSPVGCARTHFPCKLILNKTIDFTCKILASTCSIACFYAPRLFPISNASHF